MTKRLILCVFCATLLGAQSVQEDKLAKMWFNQYKGIANSVKRVDNWSADQTCQFVEGYERLTWMQQYIDQSGRTISKDITSDSVQQLRGKVVLSLTGNLFERMRSGNFLVWMCPTDVGFVQKKIPLSDRIQVQRYIDKSLSQQDSKAFLAQ